MPHYAVKLHAIVELDAEDPWQAADKARDIFAAAPLTRWLIAKIEPVLWVEKHDAPKVS